jgi:uncharacterized protein YndB with AHSA1/START domain
MGRVTRDVIFDQAPATVWSALTQPRRMSAWFGADVELDLGSGGRAWFRWADGTRRGAAVEIVDPGRYLVLRWLPFAQLPDGRTVPWGAGTIRFVLTPVRSGTRLTITESDAESMGLLRTGS